MVFQVRRAQGKVPSSITLDHGDLNHRLTQDLTLTEAEGDMAEVDGPRLLLLLFVLCWEEEASSSYFLSWWHAAPEYFRQGYWFSPRVIVRLVWRLRFARSPGLRGSSGGDSRLRVRVCRQLELLYWWCYVRQAPRRAVHSGCQWISCPLHP